MELVQPQDHGDVGPIRLGDMVLQTPSHPGREPPLAGPWISPYPKSLRRSTQTAECELLCACSIGASYTRRERSQKIKQPAPNVRQSQFLEFITQLVVFNLCSLYDRSRYGAS